MFLGTLLCLWYFCNLVARLVDLVEVSMNKLSYINVITSSVRVQMLVSSGASSNGIKRGIEL